MRAQQDRDEQTVLIGAALGVLALVLGVEALGWWIVHSAVGLNVDGAIGGAIAVLAVVTPGLATVAFVVGSERR